MKNLKNVLFVSALTLVLGIGCVSNQTKIEAAPSSDERMSTGGQAITAHKVVERDVGLNTVQFFTAEEVPGGKFLALVPDAVLAGQVPVACIFWHGDDLKKRNKKNPARLAQAVYKLWLDGLNCIAVVRPHGNNKYHWRSLSEIRLQLALLEYIRRNFGVEKFNLYGHSGGGTVAIAMAQERPSLAATVGLAAPLLSRKEHYYRRDGRIPGRAYRQYDAIDHLEKLPDIPVMVVYDPTNDRKVLSYGVVPYIKKALQLGKKVKYFKSHSGHYNIDVLGWHLRRNQEFWPPGRNE